MTVLVLNAGSSSLKFRIVTGNAGPRAVPGRGATLLRGAVERIGTAAVFAAGADAADLVARPVAARDHETAARHILDWLAAAGTAGPGSATARAAIGAVGHRVVHGGARFTAPVVIDDEVVAAIEALTPLAPLHNPASLAGIRAARAALGPGIPMVAVFDTAFHHTLPEHAAIYALPHDLARRHGIRRHGFHGIAHRSALLRYAEMTATPVTAARIVTLHLGAGCSATAIDGGRSVDTSMGFTPLEGLVMGTRAGDLDAAAVGHLARAEGVDVAEVERWLQERSGLLGLSGRSADMDVLLRAAPDDARARLAVELFCYRTAKYVGAYLAVLGGAQAVVFSGGIGEHAPAVRARICARLAWCGLILDPARNAATVGAAGRISTDGAALHAYVTPVDEELLIAEDTVCCLRAAGRGEPP